MAESQPLSRRLSKRRWASGYHKTGFNPRNCARKHPEWGDSSCRPGLDSFVRFDLTSAILSN